MYRRTLVKATAAVSALLAMPRMAFSAYSDDYFRARTASDVLTNAYGSDAVTPSNEVRLKAPDIAENGAVVPVEVETDMDAESISLLIEKNPAPLAFKADIPAGTRSIVKTRCRMGETTNVTAVVKSGGKLYTATKEVKVTIGGCGG